MSPECFMLFEAIRGKPSVRGSKFGFWGFVGLVVMFFVVWRGFLLSRFLFMGIDFVCCCFLFLCDLV